MRDLRQYTRAVAGVALVARAAAVAHIVEDRQRLADYLMGLAPLDVHDEADSAGIVLEPRIVQALLGRQSSLHLPVCKMVTHHLSLYDKDQQFRRAKLHSQG